MNHSISVGHFALRWSTAACAEKEDALYESSYDDATSVARR